MATSVRGGGRTMAVRGKKVWRVRVVDTIIPGSWYVYLGDGDRLIGLLTLLVLPCVWFLVLWLIHRVLTGPLIGHGAPLRTAAAVTGLWGPVYSWHLFFGTAATGRKSTTRD